MLPRPTPLTRQACAQVGLRGRRTATVSNGGSLTLPAKKLYEIIKALPETDVRIEEDKGGVKVAADRPDKVPLMNRGTEMSKRESTETG